MDDIISKRSAVERLTIARTLLDSVMQDIADLSEYSDKLWKTAYERGKAEAHTKGRWENTGECEERGTVRYICSECGRDDWHFPLSKISYCWNCGARMEES